MNLPDHLSFPQIISCAFHAEQFSGCRTRVIALQTFRTLHTGHMAQDILTESTEVKVGMLGHGERGGLIRSGTVREDDLVVVVQAHADTGFHLSRETFFPVWGSQRKLHPHLSPIGNGFRFPDLLVKPGLPSVQVIVARIGSQYKALSFQFKAGILDHTTVSPYRTPEIGCIAGVIIRKIVLETIESAGNRQGLSSRSGYFNGSDGGPVIHDLNDHSIVILKGKQIDILTLVLSENYFL